MITRPGPVSSRQVVDRGNVSLSMAAAMGLAGALFAGILALGVPEEVSCAVTTGISAAISTTPSTTPDNCETTPADTTTAAADTDPEATGRWEARNDQAITGAGIAAVANGCAETAYVTVCVGSDRTLSACTYTSCLTPETIPLDVFAECTTAPTTTGEGQPARRLCALQLPDQDEPRLVECRTTTSGVWTDNTAAGCTDTTNSTLDTSIAADQLATCEVLWVEKNTEGGQPTADFACTDKQGNAYSCTSTFPDPPGGIGDYGDASEATKKRAQHCNTRTFDPNTLLCDGPDPTGQTTCKVNEQLTLTCAILTADQATINDSNTWGKPTNCTRAGTPPGQQALINDCTEGINTPRTTQPRPGVGASRGLNGTFSDDDEDLQGLIDEQMADLAEHPISTMTELCSTLQPGTVVGFETLGPLEIGVPIVVGEQAPLGAANPPASIAVVAGQVSELQAVVSTLAPPLPAALPLAGHPGPPAIPPVPPVLAATSDIGAGGISWFNPPHPFITLPTAAGPPGPSILAHEYGHVLANSMGFSSDSWFTSSMHEGFADSFALLVAAQQGQPFTMHGRENEHVELGQVSADNGIHHNGTLLLNVFQTLQSSGQIPNAALQQLLINTAAQPEARANHAQFRDALLSSARRLGIDQSLVLTALEKQKWGERPVPGTCSTVSPLPQREQEDPDAGGGLPDLGAMITGGTGGGTAGVGVLVGGRC